MDCPVVTTKNGKVQGRLCTKLNDKQVFNYSKIPFAKPPVNELRFQPPQEVDSWDGVLKCDVNNVVPSQDENETQGFRDYMISMDEFNSAEVYFGPGQEDCLYLDVYTHSPNTDKKLPVLFWIYGGAFQLGGSVFYNGKVLASLHDVVVVVPNYRLNTFGFFTMGKESKYPGNMGMLDQVKALEWVRDNISAFGGNPGNVTIHGESAGGISVGLHCLSPLSKGLFHKAISHSGVADFKMLVKDDCTPALKIFLNEMGITSEDPEEIMKELTTCGTDKIMAAQQKQTKEIMNAFVVVIDGYFLPKNPTVLLQEKQFNNLPYIIGFNSDEGSGLLQRPNVNFKHGLTEEEYDQQIAMTMGLVCFQKPEKIAEVTKLVKTHYSQQVNSDDSMKWSRILGAITADLTFINPCLTTLNAYADAGQKVYMYYMNQPTAWYRDRSSLFTDDTKKAEFCDCDHGDDIMYTFGFPFYDQKYSREGIWFTEEEKECSRVWMTYVVNFASSGNPDNGNVPAAWPQYSKDHSYLEVNTKPECKKNFKPENFKLWTEKIPALLV